MAKAQRNEEQLIEEFEKVPGQNIRGYIDAIKKVGQPRQITIITDFENKFDKGELKGGDVLAFYDLVDATRENWGK